MGHAHEIEVRELKPELTNDYLRFFDQAFSDFLIGQAATVASTTLPEMIGTRRLKRDHSIEQPDPSKSAEVRPMGFSPTLTATP